jgi:hypothetical protein
MKPPVKQASSAIRLLLRGFLLASLATTSAVSAQGQWTTLFNGTDLAGWTVSAARAGEAPAPWKVENGVLIGGQGAGRGSLNSNETFKDFELVLDFMLAEHETYNSGVYFRTGYQVNIGRRESGEFVGVVVHRKAPGAIGPQGNVLWLDKGDEKYPGLRKKDDWNTLRIISKGPHIEVYLNGTRVSSVDDNPTDPAEASWREAGPISLQWPPAGEAGGFAGYVKYRNIRIRTL